MRILTPSPFDKKGLISIAEAGENLPQIVVFCIPVSIPEAKKINNLLDFEKFFLNGISTKIKERDGTHTINLNYRSPYSITKVDNYLPKFVTKIRGYKIDFYLSPLNFKQDSKHHLNIDFFYNGFYLKNELGNKRLVILEPNWSQLDKLFLEERITFTDWI